MGENYISVDEINQIISRSYNKEQDPYEQYLRDSANTDLKELPPKYEFLNTSFNPNTRMSKIQFKEIQKYRTIEKYITRNYIRYPIYSEWKEKTKIVSRSIKLTNTELETLNQNSDFLIRQFARYIVINLRNEALYPSWFIMDKLKAECIRICYNKKKEIDAYKNKDYIQIKNVENKRDSISVKIECEQQKKNDILKQKNKLQNKLSKSSASPKFLFLKIISFGIYNRYRSIKHQKEMSVKISFWNKNIDQITLIVQQLFDEQRKYDAELIELKNAILKKEVELNLFVINETSRWNEKIRLVKPLPDTYDLTNDAFVPLKTLGGLQYKKIVGCYVIHNREKDKYYVGQSKDVYKRMKQHFKGTIPNNVIFFEDYYTSKFENKDDLFEVKIISCETKDELDHLEKELIEDYNSFYCGYNGTSGNN